MKEISIATISVHAITADDALSQALKWLDGDAPKMIVTPNPEIILAAYRDPEYASILQSADLRLPDGRGLFFFGDFPERITGVDFATKLLKHAAKKRERVTAVVRVNGKSSVAQVEEAMEREFPGIVLQCVGVEKAASCTAEQREEIVRHKPVVILVGLGFPEQEQWLAGQLRHIPSVRVGMAIGGTFDFWTGVASRAPQWMRRIGLEWLYRLVREPKRIIRIWRAVVLFPIIALFCKKEKK